MPIREPEVIEKMPAALPGGPSKNAGKISGVLRRHLTFVLVLVLAVTGGKLLLSLVQFYDAHRHFVDVNFDSVYDTRAMMKGRLFADRFLLALENAQRYADINQLATAADFLEAQILHDKTFTYDRGGDNWLPPRLQQLVGHLQRLRAEIAQGNAAEVLRTSPTLTQLIADTRNLILDMDDAERDSWGELSATNVQLAQRMQTIGNQVLGISFVLAAMAVALTWLLIKKKAAESRLRQSATIEEAILERSPVGIVLTAEHDGKTIIVRANQKFAELVDLTVAGLPGRDFFQTLQPLDADTNMRWETRASDMFAGRTFSTEGRRRGANGELLWYKASCKALDIHDTHRATIWLFDDITERKESEERIWQQANFDTLTGLPNRRMFHDRLEQAVIKAHRSGTPLALMFLDLDRFKEVNDTLGHEAGDLLLKEAAHRLAGCIRETDTVARLGGDEFTVILSELHEPDKLERIARAILQRLTEPFQIKTQTVFISASIGITLFPDDGDRVDMLLRNADQAMYAAKNSGRNRYSYFTASLQEAAMLRLRLVNDLRVALAHQQFRVFYQPIVDLQSGAIRKAEALIRWQHPTRGLIAPDEFIATAEDTGMIKSIGEWVFQEAARQIAYWRRHLNAPLQMTVNMSPVQFRDGGNADWSDYLSTLGIDGDAIVVEITEGLLMDTGPVITDRLFTFRDAGIEVSIDDFGTGYASLSYLKHFDIDYLKIDQSFVRNLKPGSEDMALSEAIIVMAHKLGLKVIAEGVETPAQRDLLRHAGCDFAQGYLYSKPVPACDFEHLLAAESASA